MANVLTAGRLLGSSFILIWIRQPDGVRFQRMVNPTSPSVSGLAAVSRYAENEDDTTRRMQDELGYYGVQQHSDGTQTCVPIVLGITCLRLYVSTEIRITPRAAAGALVPEPDSWVALPTSPSDFTLHHMVAHASSSRVCHSNEYAQGIQRCYK